MSEVSDFALQQAHDEGVAEMKNKFAPLVDAAERVVNSSKTFNTVQIDRDLDILEEEIKRVKND